MQRKSFGNMQCPVARSLERVGEWWSILVLRDAFAGMTRFDEFQKSLNIAPNILTRRLTALVDAGLLERRLYCERPPRHEYVLTERGRDFRPVLISLQTWGNRHFAPEGASVMLVDARTGTPAQPILVDRVTGQPITDATHRNAAGPAAGAPVKKRLGASRKISEPKSSPSKSSPSKSSPSKSSPSKTARPEPTPATASAKPARRTSPGPRS
jgi:DNA-binding HxlR family transcriptional regulator